MARAKSFIKKLTIDEAKKSHNCQHNKQHRINKGEIRLGLKENRNIEYYCKKCSIEFLEDGVNQISKLLEQLEKS